MASIADDPGGRRRILFVAPEGSRKTVRLGKIDRKSAESICRHVEALLSSKIGGQPIPRDTAAWLTTIGEKLRDKLAAVGLIEAPEGRCVPTLGAFLAQYLDTRAAELKPSTMTVLRQAARWLLRSLDAQTPLDQVTVTDADRVRAELLRGRAKATANKWTRYAREFFNAAIHRGHIERNPFGHLKGLAVVGDQSRRALIPAEEVQKVLEVIPCPQFRLIVALARWAGLRIPSEALALRWSDIDLPNGRMIVRASKTAHHEYRGVRIVPIFPEVRKYLEELWDTLPEGAEDRVMTRYSAGDQNLRTQLNRWCLAAGVQPWRKPFQNMRATRATELADLYPSHVCSAWLGHTERIADQFYRSVTDEHFRRAAQLPTVSRGTESGTRAAQKAAQQGDANDGQDTQPSPQTPKPQEVLQSPAASCASVQICTVGDTGLEPVTLRV